MTLTERDLRTLLHAPLEPGAVDDALARSHSTRRVVARTRGPRTLGAIGSGGRRPGLIALVTAVALVGVLGVTAFVIAARPGAGRGSSATPGAAPSVSAAAFTAGATEVGTAPGSGFRTGALQLFAGSQTVDVVADGSTTPTATVYLRNRETWTDPPVDPARPAVDLGSAQARWTLPVENASATQPGGVSLVWTSSSGRAVALAPAAGSSDPDLLAAARAVVVTAPTVVRVPVSLTTLPAGWTLQGLVRTDVAYGVTGRVDGPEALDVAVDLAVPGSDDLAVAVETGGRSMSGEATGDPVEIAGRTWRWDTAAGVLTWIGPDRVLRVSALPGPGGVLRADATQLRTVVTAMTVATDFGDESSWFDATSALPS